MQGTHLTADLYSCARTDLMTDLEGLQEVCRRFLGARLTIVGEKWHQFEGRDGEAGGITGALVLAESHFAIHTWPELHRLTMDVYVCNMTSDHSDDAKQAISSIASYFEAAYTQWNDLTRGDLPVTTAADSSHFIEPIGGDGAIFGFVARKLAEDRGRQKIEVLESSSLGVALRLEDRLMTSEREGFYYHEALVHPAAVIGRKPKTALIIGGGDLGAAKEILRHKKIERVVVVEIDGAVVQCAKKHLERINGRCWEDPRLEIKIQDGAEFVRSSLDKFDLIYLDLTDVDTDAKPLYSESFFKDCRDRLSVRGVLVVHAGAVFHHDEQIRSVLGRLQAVFSYIAPYAAPAPLYGGLWTYCLASPAPIFARRSRFAVDTNLRMSGVACHELRFYGPRQHAAMFDMVPMDLIYGLKSQPRAKPSAKVRIGLAGRILFALLGLGVLVGPMPLKSMLDKEKARQAAVLSGEELRARLLKLDPALAKCALTIYQFSYSSETIKVGDAEETETYCALKKEAKEAFRRQQEKAREAKRDQDQALSETRSALAGTSL
ncbi:MULTISPECIES: bifunctional adenosylmethionine decarboxylase/class I SAM-dependent methyltransferase [Achromobacter]|uniref:bifunctional adenosylmethionine decarboxylase/class I SAM-dependent methyltransferase n=1 Tax=Achromobacter TaxID=222 RepID=UPI0023F95D78|nr:bifunctional adenosylmethionine decarboxylase/class I SAM-dependent methyltransferase [Achromobacter anxifer]MDF8364653.1 bifunctional adenosylmethionine decarboxylase/class I SAM-dependent methyltransferase [Achromobacter anxifer]